MMNVSLFSTRIALVAAAIYSLAHPQRLACASTSTQSPAVVMIVARAHGFEHSRIKHNAGKILLCVYNRSGSKKLTVHLAREDGTSVLDETLGLDKRDLRIFVDLAAGKYFLTEAGHPDWSTRIDIQ
jgi:hypothetical protein